MYEPHTHTKHILVLINALKQCKYDNEILMSIEEQNRKIILEQVNNAGLSTACKDISGTVLTIVLR